MDELSRLFQQVRFRESWRGYDPSEVDAYVEQVEKAAAWARGQIETLSERVETAAVRSDEPVEGKPETSVADDARTAEELARTLASARAAADDAIAKARQQAEQMVAEAESRVDAMIAGANAEGTRIRREADEYAASTYTDVENLAKEREAAAATTEREKHAAEISELAAERAKLAEDLELFERHVAERHQEIERSLSKLVDLVESAEIFRTAEAPSSWEAESVDGETTSAAVTDDIESSEDSDTADDEDGTGERAELDSDSGSDSDESESTGAQAEMTESAVAPESDGIVSLDASAVFDDELDLLVSEKPTDASGAGLAGSIETGHGQPRFVTVKDLEGQPCFDEPAAPPGVEDGPASSQLFDEAELSSAAARRREEEPFLAQLREAALRDNVRTDTDDALSAFFNQDEDQRRSPWFLGGR